MYWDRFDIIEAWFLALSHCHSGQSSREYLRLCKMKEYFQPCCLLSVTTLSENGEAIYRAACKRLLGE